jgi:exodeoxyribonuclease-3
VRLATWNVNSLNVRLEHVVAWLKSASPDLLALQETKTRDEDFPAEEFAALGYSCIFRGQPGYNGVAIVARGELLDVTGELGDFVDPQQRVLGATIAGVRFWNLYVPNGQAVGTEKYAYKLDWLAALRRRLAAELERYPELVVLGDFNIAPDDRDVHDPTRWHGQIMCSEPERAALGALVELGLQDVFRAFEQPPKRFSWWDYRAGAFRRNQGLRIDLVLASQALARRCTSCRIDAEPRGWPRPSDHAPVLAELGPASP